METEYVQEMIALLRQWRVGEYAMLSSYVAMLYYYATTMDLESKYIWPQANKRLGKILYLASRFSFTISCTFGFLMLPMHVDLSPKMCFASFGFWYAMSGVAYMSAEAILWACLYALLQPSKRWYPWIIALFLAFHIADKTLVSLDLASRGYGFVPTPETQRHVGYSCTDGFFSNDFHSYVARLQSTRAYPLLGKATLTIPCALYSFYAHYKRQNSRLVRVIWREGGLYYLAATIIYVLRCIFNVPGSPSMDPYGILTHLQIVRLICSERLLFRLQRRPVTQYLNESSAAFSKMVFEQRCESMRGPSTFRED